MAIIERAGHRPELRKSKEGMHAGRVKAILKAAGATSALGPSLSVRGNARSYKRKMRRG